jgi:ABC-type transporter MlaC component
MKRLTAVFTLVLAFFAGNASALGPTETIQNATSSLIQELSELEIEQRDHTQVQRLVESYILPTIDQEKIAKLALGKHWRKASEAQKISFISAFRDLQIRTYTGAFKSFNGQEFSFDEARFNKDESRAIVKGEMLQPSGQAIPIDFKMFINKQQQWKVYDAVIAGLSMVKTYRQQLSSQLQSKSLDQIIADMKSELQTAQL